MQADEFKPILQRYKIKFTKGIENTLSTFLESKTPLSAVEIHLKNTLHLATIYRILEKLESIGIISRVSAEHDQFFYELAQQAHHHHFTCISCGAIIAVSFNEGTKFKTASEYINQTYGVLVYDHDIVFRGICPDCQVGKLAS